MEATNSYEDEYLSKKYGTNFGLQPHYQQSRCESRSYNSLISNIRNGVIMCNANLLKLFFFSFFSRSSASYKKPSVSSIIKLLKLRHWRKQNTAQFIFFSRAARTFSTMWNILISLMNHNSWSQEESFSKASFQYQMCDCFYFWTITIGCATIQVELSGQNEIRLAMNAATNQLL